MASKMTRRAVLGTVIAGLAAGPFVMRALRRGQIDLPPNSFLAGLRTRFRPSLSFPREFDIAHYDGRGTSLDGGDPSETHRESYNYFSSLPKDVSNVILKTHKRYWHNFSQIDEIEFDCTHYDYKKDGTKENDYTCFEGHVRLKYGYGMEIIGKNVEGKSIHWIFNLDGRIEGPAVKFNMSNMMLEFFQARKALPEAVMLFDHVFSTEAKLPENPYLQANSDDTYTVLTGGRYLQFMKLPPHVEGKAFAHYYYNNRTGMLEYFHNSTFAPTPRGDKIGNVFLRRRNSEGKSISGDNSVYFNTAYEDPSVPLPALGRDIEYYKNVEVENGIYLPVEYGDISDKWKNGFFQKATYSNIKIKKV